MFEIYLEVAANTALVGEYWSVFTLAEFGREKTNIEWWEHIDPIFVTHPERAVLTLYK